MVLSSASTLDEIFAAYLDNAGYEENGSVAQARAFVTACRMLLGKLPTRSASGDGSEVEYDPATIRREKELARRFIRANSGGHVRYASFRNFRD